MSVIENQDGKKAKLHVNSTHSLEERGLDAYFTCPEAVYPLMELEDLPPFIEEPACGDGAIAKVLSKAGHSVDCHDIQNYGYPGTQIRDYLKHPIPNQTHRPIGYGVVTNPPFRHSRAFAERALAEYNYVALFCPFNWLETVDRKSFFEESGLSRIWLSSRRLPMMHRFGYVGPKSTSNRPYAWFIWDHRINSGRKDYFETRLFDWKSYLPGVEMP